MYLISCAHHKTAHKMSYKCILLITWTWMSQFNTYHSTYCKEGTERINYILDTLLTEYTQQESLHASNIFHHMCSMQVSKSAWLW